MKYSLYVGRVLGVKIYIHWTFVLLFFWITASAIRNNVTRHDLIWISGLILSVFACVVFHELGHAVMARKFGVITKHITLLPIGGVAELDRIPEKPKQELLISLAGPAVNIAIALLLFPFINIHHLLQEETIVRPNSANFLFTLVVVNFWLAAFNLIPAFPMDGGRVLRSILAFWMNYVKATKIATYAGQVFMIAFFVLGLVYNPMLIFIAFFVLLSGQQELVAVKTRHLLHKYTVKDVLISDVPTLDSNLTLKSAAQKLLDTQNKSFVVIDEAIPVGTLSRDEIIKAASDYGENVMIGRVRNSDLTFVSKSTPLDEAWAIMQKRNTPVIMVGSKDYLEGILELENVSEFLALKSAIKTDTAASAENSIF
jgi:Zn-dependent protease/predicted transcriptional regulator